MTENILAGQQQLLQYLKNNQTLLILAKTTKYIALKVTRAATKTNNNKINKIVFEKKDYRSSILMYAYTFE